MLLLRLFPATPKQPEVLYTMDMLELCDQLVENAHSSVGRLATSLKASGRSQGGLQPQREGILLPDTLVEEALLCRSP